MSPAAADRPPAAAEVSVNHPRRDGRRHAVHPGERARVQKVHRRAQRPTGGRAHRRERVLPKVAAARLFLLDDDGVRRVAPSPPARISCAIAKRSPRHCDCLAALWNLFAGNDLHSACNARTITTVRLYATAVVSALVRPGLLGDGF